MTIVSGDRIIVMSSGYGVGYVRQIIAGGSWFAWFNGVPHRIYCGRFPTADDACRAVLDYLNGHR